MTKSPRPIPSLWSRLWRDRRGSLAPIAAVAGLTLVIAAGAAVDIGRAARIHSLLQDDADNAALAGAAQSTSDTATTSAQAYVTASLANLTDKPTITNQTYTYDNTTNPAAPTMNVALTAVMPNTIMAFKLPSVTMTVSAKASAAIMKQYTIDIKHVNSSAVDYDALYAFGYNASTYKDGSTALYKFAPASSNTDDWQCIYANHTTSGCPTTVSTNNPPTVTIPWADSVAFAFSNETETGGNCYGLSNNSVTWYYSTRLDSAGRYHDYPTATINFCGFSTTQAATDGSGATIVNNIQATNGASSSPNYNNQCLPCLGIQSSSGAYYWPCTPPTSGSHQGQCATGGSGRNTTYTTAKRYNAPSGAQWNMSMMGNSSLQYAYIYPLGGSRNPLALCQGDTTESTSCTVATNGQACDGSTITYEWDDNGGGSDAAISSSSNSADDDDGNDIRFTLTCTRVVGQAGAQLVN